MMPTKIRIGSSVERAFVYGMTTIYPSGSKAVIQLVIVSPSNGRLGRHPASQMVFSKVHFGSWSGPTGKLLYYVWKDRFWPTPDKQLRSNSDWIRPALSAQA